MHTLDPLILAVDFGQIGGIFGLLGSAVAAFTILLSARQRATVAVLTQSNDAHRERLDQLEKAEQRCLEQVASLRGANQVLTDLVTSKARVEELADLVTSRHNEVVAMLKILMEKVK